MPRNENDSEDTNLKKRNTTAFQLFEELYGTTVFYDQPNDSFDCAEQHECPEGPYIHVSENEFGAAGELVEVLGEENKSLIWFLMRQIRPGMDLSKVVLPTFILEPRSFLDKLSDAYFHADILSKAVAEDDPFARMKLVVTWYMSGFYKKPLGLKKPYNPIIGETFRCYWEHPNKSHTFYIAEQVSHHPPISVFYVSNQKDGFSISCSLLTRSKFYGNSTSAFLEGVATLTLLPRGEIYTLSTPYVHCKGFLIGTLSMEWGGTVHIICENTGYKSEIEFKLRSFLSRSDSSNAIAGKIQLGKETIATISGFWDREIKIKDTKSNEPIVVLNINDKLKKKRLKRYVVKIHNQHANESEKLWEHVTEAIRNNDQITATEEKSLLEEAQRIHTKDTKQNDIKWEPRLFTFDNLTGQYIYKYADLRPWDSRNDIRQYEYEYRILTRTHLKVPEERTTGIFNSNALILPGESPKDVELKSIVRMSVIGNRITEPKEDNNSYEKLISAINALNNAVSEHSKKLDEIDSSVKRIESQPTNSSQAQAVQNDFQLTSTHFSKVIMYVLLAVAIRLLIKWFRS